MNPRGMGKDKINLLPPLKVTSHYHRGAANGKILTCARVGLGGCCPRWPSYLAGPFDPTGLGRAHVSSCDLLDPQGLCPSVGTDWPQTIKTTGCSSVTAKLFSPHPNQVNKKIKIKTNKKCSTKRKTRKREEGEKVLLTRRTLFGRKKETLLDFI